MATNSKREQIIEYVVGELEGIDGFTVTRQLPRYADLQQVAATQFPLIAVASGFPVPVEHKQSRAPGGADVFLSALRMDLFVFEQINEDCDTKLSELADDVWAKVWGDQTKGALVHSMSAEFGEVPTYLRPYISFRLTLTVVYKHTTGGI